MSGPDDRESLFNHLYDEHNRAVHAYFLGRTSDQEAALDLLQETFVRVWRSIQLLQSLPGDRRRYWVFTVARNLLTDHYRASATRSAVHESLAREWAPGVGAQGTVEAAIAKDESHRLDRAIRRLPEEQRVILVLKVLGGLSSARIGELVGRPSGTVRYQLFLARRSLARDLECSQ
jgi:RNA polymerase sigma-70 factor, ECF subfamily